MAAWTYMLRCADGTFYIGCTTDLEQRMNQHSAGTFGGYTSTRRPVELVWVGETPTIHDAIDFERRIKGWSRAKKEALIREIGRASRFYLIEGAVDGMRASRRASFARAPQHDEGREPAANKEKGPRSDPRPFRIALIDAA